MTRRRIVITVAAAAAVLLVVAAMARPEPDDDRYGVFCGLYPKIDKMTAMLERGLEGQAKAGDLPPSNYRNLRVLVWSDKNAESGPEQLTDDAVLIATAVRAAATDDDPAPLQSNDVREAVARLGPEATEFCREFDD